MKNIKLLILIITAFGLTNSKRMFRKCTFCHYFYTTGHTPYELLWILNDEISAYLSDDQRITLFLDEDDLIKAELVFETFCENTCSKNLPSAVSKMEPGMSHTGPRSAFRLKNKAFYEPQDSEMSSEFTMPSRKRLFEKVKNSSYSERASSAEKVPSIGSRTTRKENNNDGLERTWGEELRRLSGEYEISGTLLSNGSSDEYSGSAETRIYSDGSGSGTASDEIRAAVADSDSECSDPPCGLF